MNTVKAIQPLPLVTRRSLVVDALREAILTGELPPGTKITEMDLVARLQVSPRAHSRRHSRTHR